MSIKLHRFDYGNLRDFRAPLVASVLPDVVLEDMPPPPPPPPTFSEEELEAVRAEVRQAAYAEGFEAGMTRAAEQAEATRQTVDNTIMQFGSVINSLQREYHQILFNESAALSELVVMIARKITGTILDINGAESINSLIAQCLPAVLTKPRLTIELNPDAFDKTIDRIETLLHANGFEGELQFRANEELGPYDTVLNWGSGQAERSLDAIWKEIESLLATMPIQLQLPDMGDAAQPIPPTV